MTDPRAEVEALREDRETIAAYREVHYYIGPSLSPDNLDDSGQCSCGQDDECDILTLLAILARPAPPSGGLDVMAKFVLSHGVHSPFCMWVEHGAPCDCGFAAASKAARAALTPADPSTD